jgi:hypothetical protein
MSSATARASGYLVINAASGYTVCLRGEGHAA